MVLFDSPQVLGLGLGLGVPTSARGGRPCHGVEHAQATLQEVDGPLVVACPAEYEAVLRLPHQLSEGSALVEAAVHVVTECVGRVLQVVGPQPDLVRVPIVLTAVPQVAEPVPDRAPDHQVEDALVSRFPERVRHQVRGQVGELPRGRVVAVHPSQEPAEGRVTVAGLRDVAVAERHGYDLGHDYAPEPLVRPIARWPQRDQDLRRHEHFRVCHDR